MPGYSPTTVNLYDSYFVARDGVIVDVWPVWPGTDRPPSPAGPAAA